MNYLKERVAYLKGLAEGMQISDATNEGKLLKAIIEVLDDVALAVDDIEEVQEQLSEQIDNMDEDLAEIEAEIFDEDYDDTEDAEEAETIDGEFECPHCGEIINIEAASFNDEKDSIKCPHCHKDIEIEWDCDCDNCDDHNH
jgi:hypothetical protein